MFSNIKQDYQVMKDHSKVKEMPLWTIQSVKNEIFGRFLDLGLLDRLDIAYFGRTICFPTFGNTTRSWWVIQKPSKCVFEWSKVPKRRILAVFWTWFCWIDSILHILIELNICDMMCATGSTAFCSMWHEVFDGFLGFVLLDRVGITYCDIT